jgi:hypothetical protein
METKERHLEEASPAGIASAAAPRFGHLDLNAPALLDIKSA